MLFIHRDGIRENIRHYDHFRNMASKFHAKRVAVRGKGLTIECDEGILAMVFPTLRAIHAAVANWRCLEGLPLSVDGKKAGVVGRHNPALI